MLKTIIKFTFEQKGRNTREQILTHDRSDQNTCTKSTRLQGINTYYTANKKLKCHGVTVTISDMKTKYVLKT